MIATTYRLNTTTATDSITCMAETSVLIDHVRRLIGEPDLKAEKNVLHHVIQQRGDGVPAVQRRAVYHSAVAVEPGMDKMTHDLDFRRRLEKRRN